MIAVPSVVAVVVVVEMVVVVEVVVVGGWMDEAGEVMEMELE